MSSMPSPADQKPSTACLCTTLAKSLHGSMSGLAFLLLFFMGFVVVVLFVCLFRVISFLSSATLSTQYALMNFFVCFFACWYVRACVRACNTTPLKFALFTKIKWDIGVLSTACHPVSASLHQDFVHVCTHELLIPFAWWKTDSKWTLWVMDRPISSPTESLKASAWTKKKNALIDELHNILLSPVTGFLSKFIAQSLMWFIRLEVLFLYSLTTFPRQMKRGKELA